MLLDQMVTRACEAQGIDRSDLRFSRSSIRAFTHWQDTQVRVHLDRLVSLEYVLVHRGGRGQTFVYELLYDGQGKQGERFVIGLCDVEALAKAQGLPVPVLPASLEPLAPAETERTDEGTTPTSRGFQATPRGHRGPIAPLPRGGRGSEEPAPHTGLSPVSAESAETSHLEATPKTYAQGGRSDRGPAHPLVSPGALGGRGAPRLNLLRFPPLESAAEDARGRASHGVLMMRRAARGF
jgi:hypothetical protein